MKEYITTDDIIRMAREAGFDVVGDLYGENTIIANLTQLVELEREACAKLCESLNEDFDSLGVEACIEAIRARGQG